MKKTALILMVLTVISKVLGLLREVTLSYFYGTSNISDAYLISQTIPVVIFSFVGVGISTGYIPIYTNIEQKQSTEKANHYTNNLFNILVAICILIIIFGVIYARQIVALFASGFDRNTLNLAVFFTRISLISIIFTSFIHLFSAFLQLKNNYIVPALVSVPMNLLIIVSVIVSSNGNIYILAVGSVFAILSQVIFFTPFVYRKGYRYRPIIDLHDNNIKSMLILVLPVILGVAVNDINVLIDRTLASQIAVGGISALNYANKLNRVIHGIFVLSVSTVIYPKISKMATNNNTLGYKSAISEAVVAINLLLLPATVGIMILGEPIVRILFGRGAFNIQAIKLTSTTLFFYSIGMLGFGMREVISKAFYSMQDTKTPMINATLGMIINIVLNIILSRFMGIGGLALATSISATITSGLMFISLRRSIGPLGMKRIIVSFFKILFASSLMGLLVKISYNHFINLLNQYFSLVLAISIGATAYFLLIYYMKIEDVDMIISVAKKKLRRKR